MLRPIWPSISVCPVMLMSFVQRPMLVASVTMCLVLRAEGVVFTLRGMISSCSHGAGRSAPDKQHYFVNSRPCDPLKVSPWRGSSHRWLQMSLYSSRGDGYKKLITNGKWSRGLRNRFIFLSIKTFQASSERCRGQVCTVPCCVLLLNGIWGNL